MKKGIAERMIRKIAVLGVTFHYLVVGYGVQQLKLLVYSNFGLMDGVVRCISLVPMQSSKDLLKIHQHVMHTPSL